MRICAAGCHGGSCRVEGAADHWRARCQHHDLLEQWDIKGEPPTAAPPARGPPRRPARPRPSPACQVP